jgi:hypothetical protein
LASPAVKWNESWAAARRRKVDMDEAERLPTEVHSKLSSSDQTV